MYLLGILVCIGIASTKYIETPSHVFKVFDNTTKMAKRAYLSPDSDQLMVFTYDLTNQSHVSQSIFYFNGTKACTTQYNNSQYSFEGWILGTKGLIEQYDQQSKKTFFKKQDDICGDPVDILTVQQSINHYEIRNTSQSSFVTILFNHSKFIQYDLNTGNFYFIQFRYAIKQIEGQSVRNFTLSDTQQVYNFRYSPDQKLIFTQMGPNNIVIFDANTLQKVKQMKNGDNNPMALIYGFNDGKSFLGVQISLFSINYIDEQTNRATYVLKNQQNKDFAGFCGMNNTFVTVTQSRTGQRLITYDSRNGDVIQNFSINLQGKFNTSRCNDNYLSLIDVNGYAYIFTYNHTQPQPDPDPKPEPDPKPLPDNNTNLLTILQIVGSITVIQTIVITIILGCVCHKRRKRNKQRQQQRSHLLEEQAYHIN